MKEFFKYLLEYRKLKRITGSPVWDAAGKAVLKVIYDIEINKIAQDHPMTVFCPRCGQLPDGDRRYEEARELAISYLSTVPKRSDLDFALAWQFWRLKNA
jgi:hypothetical protein